MRWQPIFSAILLVAAVVGLFAWLEQRSAPATGEPHDPLAALGFAVSGGAAPGYVDDRACALCHQGLYNDYQHLGMAQSFFRPAVERDIETFAAAGSTAPSFQHAASGMAYQMQRQGERLVFRQWQPDATGERRHLLELDIDWVMGSGHTSRVYIVQTPGGELYQLPLAWYTQGAGWAMAPGFDSVEHGGLTRRLRRECMFCHNGYPDVEAGSDSFGAPHTFPADLPEGIGCQRCHGPGAEHSRLALGDADSETVRTSILDPIDLPAARRDDVCHQCHLQPTVALPGVRPFGVGDYAFRAGYDLNAFLLYPDIKEEGRTMVERFEINHHPYRLEQSRCFLESPPGDLSCLSCHDPHRKVEPARRVEHYRQACLSCHEVDACQLDAMTGHADLPDVSAQDCTACHMPQRRTQDVVHVAMTDHRIQRRAPPGALAPLEEVHPPITDLWLRQPENLPPQLQLHADLYAVTTLVRLSGAASPAGIEHLERLLASQEPPFPEPYLDLAHARLLQQRPDDAMPALTAALARLAEAPHDSATRAQALEWRALALAQKGQYDIAIEQLDHLLDQHPDRFEARFNLARLLRSTDDLDAARRQYERLLQLRPLWPNTHYQYGELLRELGDLEQAAEHYRRTLQLDPRHLQAEQALARVAPDSDG